MSFWRRISPRRAVEDFAQEWKQPTPYRWQALAIAVAATAGMMIVFLPENQRIEPRPPQITWITTYAPDRTREEIIASNIENQRRKEELAELERQREEFRKSLYRELGRATGLDVKKMEAEIEREQRAEEAAQKAAMRERSAAARNSATSDE